MLPHQASTPLRWVLRPCVRLYTHHCAALSVSGARPDTHKWVSTSVRPSLVPPSTGSAANISVASPHPFCGQSSRPLFTSCAVCDVAQLQAEDGGIKALRFENGGKVQEIVGASFEEVMDLAQKVDSAFLACVVLQRVGVLHSEGQVPTGEGQALLQDGRLRAACKVIDDNIGRLSPRVILKTLQELYRVSEADVPIVKSLAMQVIWLMRRLPIPLVIQALQVHQQHQETSLRVRVVEQALAVLERRWVEVSNPKDIIFLMYITQAQSAAHQGLLERLEDRALDIVEKANPKELYRIIYLLSRQRHRNTPLIRAVIYHLNKNSVSSLSAVQLTNLVYALCVLNVFDASVLSKVSVELLNKQADLTPKLVSSLLTSFSRLRWKEDSVLQMLMNVLEGTETLVSPSSQGSPETEGGSSVLKQKPLLDALDVSDKVGLLVTLANLNVDTVQSRGLVEKIGRLPEVQGLRQTSPLLWLDTVWSLSVLQMADSAAVASVLTEDFWGKLPSTDSFQSMVNMTKVTNINAAARFELEGYTGPFLPPTITAADAKQLQKGERKVTEKLVSALTNMAPQESYSLLNTTAPGGYLIDAEFFVDNSGNPKPLSQVSENSAGYHRVALKVLDFPDLTLPTSDLTGLHAMAARHLHYQGYTVVQVKYSEMPTKSKVVELVNFLQQKVKDSLKTNQNTPPGS